MKERFKFLVGFILLYFLLLAGFSAIMATTFRDVRTGPMGEYLTGYLWPRFMEFFMIFAPLSLVGTAVVVVGWLVYEWDLRDRARKR